MKKMIIGICLTTMLNLGCSAYDGQLDSTFNGTGQVVTSINNVATLSAMAIQDDGKIVVGGSSGLSALATDITLARYNTDGTLDRAFGTQGTGLVITTLGGILNTINALVIQPDSKIVVAGSGSAANTGIVVRYNKDGTLDTAFGNNGIVITNVGPAAFFGVALQKDGKIVTVGPRISGTPQFMVARYYGNGQLDNGSQGGSGFGTNGTVFFTIAENDEARTIAVQEDGKIVVGGSATVEGLRNFVAARLLESGALDATFGENGIVSTAFSGDAQAMNLVVQPDGKIVLAGSVSNGNNRDFALVRYEGSGSLDIDFGNGGQVVTDLGGDDQIFQIVLQSNGKIVVGGATNVGGLSNFTVARYTVNGVLDQTFNPSGTTPGIVITSFDGLATSAFQVALQQNGPIVLGGTVDANNGFALARYLNNTPLVITQITSPLNGTLFSNATFIVSGVAQNPSNIGIFADGLLIGRAITEGSANSWTTTTTVPLEDGVHTITAVAEYKDGNVNLASANSVSFCINTCRSPLSAAIASKYCSNPVS